MLRHNVGGTQRRAFALVWRNENINNLFPRVEIEPTIVVLQSSLYPRATTHTTGCAPAPLRPHLTKFCIKLPRQFNLMIYCNKLL